MGKLINCMKCGKLFVSNKWNLCDECYKGHKDSNQEIIDFIINSEEERVKIKDIISHFKISPDKILDLISQGKFIQCADKMVFNCIACGSLSTARNCYSFLCLDCSKKIKYVVGPPRKVEKIVSKD